MKKLVAALSAVTLSGCVSLSDIKQQEPLYNGSINGDYSALARCVADRMQTHEKWTVRGLQYNVRVYPDIEKAELQAYAHSAYTGPIYSFFLELKKFDQGISHALLRGNQWEGPVALETLHSCSGEEKAIQAGK